MNTSTRTINKQHQTSNPTWLIPLIVTSLSFWEHKGRYQSLSFILQWYHIPIIFPSSFHHVRLSSKFSYQIIQNSYPHPPWSPHHVRCFHGFPGAPTWPPVTRRRVPGAARHLRTPKTPWRRTSRRRPSWTPSDWWPRPGRAGRAGPDRWWTCELMSYS